MTPVQALTLSYLIPFYRRNRNAVKRLAGTIRPKSQTPRTIALIVTTEDDRTMEIILDDARALDLAAYLEEIVNRPMRNL